MDLRVNGGVKGRAIHFLLDNPLSMVIEVTAVNLSGSK